MLGGDIRRPNAFAKIVRLRRWVQWKGIGHPFDCDCLSHLQKIMQIARVIGTVVSTIKNASLDGRKFLIVQTLDADLKEKGKPMIALDAVGAGEGELVFWCRGKEASFPFKRDETPTDCTIVGIIDSDEHVLNRS